MFMKHLNSKMKPLHERETHFFLSQGTQRGGKNSIINLHWVCSAADNVNEWKTATQTLQASFSLQDAFSK